MGFLGKLLLGGGKLKPEMHAALESEGLVLIEEGLSASVRYTHFKAPGKRFHGKVTPERVGIGISRERVAVYCRGGGAKLIDSRFSSPNFDWVDIGLDGDDEVSFRIDYDRADVMDVAGQIEIRVKTPTAARIVDELRARLGR